MRNVKETEMKYLTMPKSVDVKAVLAWKNLAEVDPDSDKIVAKAYFRGTPHPYGKYSAAGFAIVEINSDLSHELSASESRAELEEFARRIKNHVTWVKKLSVTFSGSGFTTAPFAAALVNGVEAEGDLPLAEKMYLYRV